MKNKTISEQDISNLYDVLEITQKQKDLERLRKIAAQEEKTTTEEQSWVVSDSSSSFSNLN